VVKKPSDIVQLKLRFPEALRKKLERAAKARDHSMNAEIIHRLDRSFHNDPAVDMVELAMWLESTSDAEGAHLPPKKNWRENPESASAVRYAVDQIITAVAGLPPEPVVSDRGRAEVLATVVLRKFGLSIPTYGRASS
jgi:hypothetical protein